MIEPFTKLLLSWHDINKRSELPWNNTKDPYRIWLSEIILQQTQVKQGRPYYEKFVKKYPTIQALAAATEEEVMKQWQGLGYYSRARNMHSTAKVVSNEYAGRFPSEYKEILKLKGVGKYTAAAIASFAFGHSYAAVDGNMIRVLSRVFGVSAVDGYPKFLKDIDLLADQMIVPDRPADFNRAIMDFGSIVCKAKLPQCLGCPIQDSCIAFNENMVGELPPKKAKVAVQKRYYIYLVFNKDGKTLIRKRGAKDFWQGLYEFYLIEQDSAPSLSDSKLKALIANELQIQDFGIDAISLRKQRLTHRLVTALFINITVADSANIINDESSYHWTDIGKLNSYAFPRMIAQYLEDLVIN